MRDPLPDYATIAPRVMRPAAPNLMAARNAAAGALHAGEAWETFAARGIIPVEWVTDRQRIFGSGKRRFEPQTLAAAVTFAADVRGVVAAESLAREVEARLEPWTGVRGRRIVWRVRRADAPTPLRNNGVYAEALAAQAAWRALEQLPEAPRETSSGAPPRPRGFFRRLLDALTAPAPLPRPWETAIERERRRINAETALLTTTIGAANTAPLVRYWVLADASAERAWARAAEAGARVPDALPYVAAEIPEAVRGQPFASLPNPFAPLLALWGTGYALRGIDRDAIRLVAYELPSAVPPPPERVSLGVYR